MGKRVFDLVVGTVLSLVALPMILVFAVALAISLRAWPFFLQERIGQHGRHFRILKLRTLPPSTPRYALKSALDLDSLPALSRFLRRSHLDELPQLFCVLSGDLSLVGPRPKMPDVHEPVDPTYSEARESVPQGCTGLWQIGPEVDRLPSHSPEYDFFYLQNRSLALDVWIVWRTLLVMAHVGSRRGLDEIPAWMVAGPARSEQPIATYDAGRTMVADAA